MALSKRDEDWNTMLLIVSKHSDSSVGTIRQLLAAHEAAIGRKLVHELDDVLRRLMDGGYVELHKPS